MLYRSEIPFGDGVRDIVEVLAYETFDLGNSDVIMYLMDEVFLGDSDFKENAVSIITKKNAKKKDWLSFYKYTLGKLCKKYKKDLKYCLWLSTYNDVRNYYGKGELRNEDIDVYEESEIVLCDLYCNCLGGKLFAYDEMPKKLGTAKDF